MVYFDIDYLQLMMNYNAKTSDSFKHKTSVIN